MEPFRAKGTREILASASAAIVLSLFATASATAEQFFAKQAPSGEIVVVDETGAPVPFLVGDPVGEKPDLCPADTFYVAEEPEDISQLILTDCATSQARHTVEIMGSDTAGQ
jgi:hypothetical protein